MPSTENKQPWTVPGVPWKTESAFWVWVRGVLRKGWSKHPVKLEYIKKYRKQINNPNPKGKKDTVWGMTCSKCGEDHVQSNIEIDHISDTGGTFTGLEDVKDYVEYLFLIDFDSIRPVCKPCHKAITYAQRESISFTEAVVKKKTIEFVKQDKEIVIDFCQKHSYTKEMLNNAAKRREAVEAIFREEYNRCVNGSITV